jgi:hypothetical protein
MYDNLYMGKKMNNNTIKLGWSIPLDVREKFTDWCDSVGLKTQDAAAGALVLFPEMPPHLIQECILASKGKPLNEQFWAEFRRGCAIGLKPPQNSPGKSPK